MAESLLNPEIRLEFIYDLNVMLDVQEENEDRFADWVREKRGADH